MDNGINGGDGFGYGAVGGGLGAARVLSGRRDNGAVGSVQGLDASGVQQV